MNLIQIDNDKIYGRFQDEFLQPCKGEFELSIKECFKNQGFIAGGFARFLCKIQDKSHINWRDSVIKYIQYAQSDIDFFFPTKQNRDATQNEIFKYHKSGLISPFATTVRTKISPKSSVPIDIQIPIQLIGIVVGNMHKVLEQFDFHNSMFCFNEHIAQASEEGIEAENKNELKIYNFGSSNLPTRIRKYMRKYDYKGLSNESQVRFVDWCFQVTQWLSSANKQPSKVSEFLTFCWRVKQLTYEMGVFSDSDLLLLGSIFNTPGCNPKEDYSYYEQAFVYSLPGAIIRRSTIKPLRVDWNKEIRK